MMPRLSALALILALAAAAPAAADCESDCVEPPDPTVLLTGGTMVTRATLGPVVSVASSTIEQATHQTLNQSATGQVLDSVGLSNTVAVQCSASAFPNALATSVEQCYLLSRGHQRFDAVTHGALPGPADATVTAVFNVPSDKWKVCVQTNTFFQDNTYLEAPLVCS
jgi:hypothetical protein